MLASHDAVIPADLDGQVVLAHRAGAARRAPDARRAIGVADRARQDRGDLDRRAVGATPSSPASRRARSPPSSGRSRAGRGRGPARRRDRAAADPGWLLLGPRRRHDLAPTARGPAGCPRWGWSPCWASGCGSRGPGRGTGRRGRHLDVARHLRRPGRAAPRRARGIEVRGDVTTPDPAPVSSAVDTYDKCKAFYADRRRRGRRRRPGLSPPSTSSRSDLLTTESGRRWYSTPRRAKRKANLGEQLPETAES